MKKTVLVLVISLIAISGYAQSMDGIIAQPTHVIGKRINASGQITYSLEADFTYDEEGKFFRFLLPNYNLSSAFVYDGNYLSFNCTSHNGGYPSNMECIEYTYEEGRIKHISHEWDQMNAPKHWEYSYSGDGRLRQIDYSEGYEINYQQHYIYEYENGGNTVIENHWTSWDGMKLRKKTIKRYDDKFNLSTVLVEAYSASGVLAGSTLETYTYTLEGFIDTQTTQSLIDKEWVNTGIQRFVYDSFGRMVEQQNGAWSDEIGDWDITKTITFEYKDMGDTAIYTVSFYKKSGENWVWDVFDNQTILFGSHLKNQQKSLAYFDFEDYNGSGQINQFEFTFVDTPEPNYMDVEDNEQMPCTVHPNPTTGRVVVTGENLLHAEAVNVLGQRVAAAKGEGETLQLDLSHLPAGVYFVSVTDDEGRKCVRKVVKE